MAARMSEQHKQQMAKIQQASQRIIPAQSPIVATGGQTNILNYLTRSQKPNPVNSVVGQQQPGSSKSIEINDSVETDKKDEESLKGHFGKI